MLFFCSRGLFDFQSTGKVIQNSRLALTFAQCGATDAAGDLARLVEAIFQHCDGAGGRTVKAFLRIFVRGVLSIADAEILWPIAAIGETVSRLGSRRGSWWQNRSSRGGRGFGLSLAPQDHTRGFRAQSS